MTKGMTPRDLPKSGPTCPRKGPAPSKPIIPTVGQFVTIFLASPRGWQADLGTGWRNFIVLKVGRKWITLFNPARLKSFEIDLLEWNELKPRLYDPAPEGLAYLSAAIPAKVAQYESYSMQHRAACTAKALEIVNGQLEKLP